MENLYELVIQRLSAVLLSDASSTLQAQFLSRDAARRAELLELAKQYEERGLTDVAVVLSEQADQITLDQPLGAVLPVLQQLPAVAADNPALTQAGPDPEAAEATEVSTTKTQKQEGTSTRTTRSRRKTTAK